jgi:hypothetical protein
MDYSPGDDTHYATLLGRWNRSLWYSNKSYGSLVLTQRLYRSD